MIINYELKRHICCLKSESVSRIIVTPIMLLFSIDFNCHYNRYSSYNSHYNQSSCNNRNSK